MKNGMNGMKMMLIPKVKQIENRRKYMNHIPHQIKSKALEL